jgi:hypothetical protein
LNTIAVPVGTRSGYLRVVDQAPSSNGSRWFCLCMACKRIAVVRGVYIRSGKAKSCGCRQHENTGLIHGDTVGNRSSPEYMSWSSMKSRCYNKSTPGYRYYGGRGVRVCSQWKKSFTNFLADVGRRPTPLHSLDRFPDRNGNYEPKNVRWATQVEQQNNRNSNVFMTLGSETFTAAIWARRLGLDPRNVARRVRNGWSDFDALMTPNGGVRPSAADDVLITLGSETFTAVVWERRLGLSNGCVSVRIRSGWSVFDALMTPSGYGVRRVSRAGR